MAERKQMLVSFYVTESQALTLRAMFEYWNSLGSMGSSRKVAFYADGDGDFKPNCEIICIPPLRRLTDDIRKAAIAKDEHGDRLYDFDGVGWFLQAEKDKRKAEIEAAASRPQTDESESPHMGGLNNG